MAMDTQLAEIIQQLLNEKAVLVENMAIPSDYSSVREAILLTELQQEIATLRKMLEDLPNFEELFLARCADREIDTKNSVSFHNLPESLTNKLYWDIATLVFQPKSMKEMLNIITPAVKNYLKPTVNYEQIQSTQSYRVHASLEKVTNLDTFDEKEPTIETLSQCILVDDLLFNIKEIALYPLDTQAELQTLLENDYPNLAKRLYEHNNGLATLYQDIITIRNKGTTPKTAIEQLIKGLLAGGEKMTNKEFADIKALNAVNRFMDYFNLLPKTTQEELKALTADNMTLDDILKRFFTDTKCIEETSLFLTRLLKRNSSEVVLNTSIGITRAELKEIRAKYSREHGLDTKKEENSITYFPSELTKEVINRIKFQKEDDIIKLFINFPTNFYEVFWQNIEVENPTTVFEDLSYIIATGFFNPEQKLALVKAIIDQYQRFELPVSLVNWASTTEDLIFLEETLKSISNDQRLSQLTEIDQNGHAPIHYISQNPEALEIMLSSLSEKKDKFKALTSLNGEGYSALYYSIDNPKSLEFLLSQISKDDMPKVLATKYNDKPNETLLHYSALSSTEAFKLVLNAYSPENRLAAIKEQSDSGWSLLNADTVQNPELVRTIVSVYPKEERYLLLFPPRGMGTPLTAALYYPESLKVMLSLLKKDEVLELLQKKIGKESKSYIELASNHPETLTLIFSILSEDDKLKILESKTSSDVVFLHSLVADKGKFGLLGPIFSQLSDENKLKALNIKNENDETIVELAVRNPSVFKDLLVLVPEKYLAEVLTAKNKNNSTPVHIAALNHNEDSPLKDILLKLPDDSDSSFTVMTSQNIAGETPMHYVVKNSALTELVLEKLPKNKRFQALTLANKKGETPLDLLTTPALLVSMLEQLPKEEQIKVLATKTQYGKTYLHPIMANLELLEKTLITLSKEHQPEELDNLLSNEDGYGNSCLGIASRIPGSLELILKYLPKPEDKLKAAQMKDTQGRTLLHYATITEHIQYPLWKEGKIVVGFSKPASLDSIESILRLYPKDARFEAITTPDSKDRTPLENVNMESLVRIIPLLKEEDILKVFAAHRIILQHSLLNNSFTKIVHTLSEKGKIKAFSIQGQGGKTLLHDATTTFQLRMILSSLKPQNRLALLMKKDLAGNTPLQKFNIPALRENIKPLLTDDEWSMLFPVNTISNELTEDAISSIICFETLSNKNLLSVELQTALKNNVPLRDLVVQIFNSEYSASLNAKSLGNTQSVQEFLLGLIENYPKVMQFAENNLQNDPVFMLRCAAKNIATLEYASDELKSKIPFIKAAVKIDSKALDYLPPEASTDIEIKRATLHYEHANPDDSRLHLFTAKSTLNRFKSQVTEIQKTENLKNIKKSLEGKTDQEKKAIIKEYKRIGNSKDLTGDALKTAILQEFKESLKGKTEAEIDIKAQEFKKSDEYKILANAQGLIYSLFNIDTTSKDAVEEIIKDAKQLAEKYYKPQV
jgi:hypothetical protein